MVSVRRYEGHRHPYLAGGGLVLVLALSAPGAAVGQTKAVDQGARATQKTQPEAAPSSPTAAPIPPAITKKQTPAPIIAAPYELVYPDGCHNAKSDQEENLCIEGRAADAAERSALWAALTFGVGITGIIGVIWTLMYTARAANAAKKAAEVAEKALTDLERPFVVAEFDVSVFKFIEDGRGTHLRTGIVSALLHNFGRTPANLNQIFWDVAPVEFGQMPEIIDPTVTRGRDLPVGTVSVPDHPFEDPRNYAGAFLAQRSRIISGTDIIFITGFVRYSDLFAGHYIHGFCVALDITHERYARLGGERYNYHRKERPEDIPPPTRPSET